MKKILLTVLSLLCFISFASADLKNVTPEELQEAILKGVVIVDIRTAKEWDSTGVIPTSHKITFFDSRGNYDIDDWLSKFQKIVKDKNQTFILVCRSGNRTRRAGNYLSKKLNYKNVFHLKRGIKSWIAEGRKTVK